MRCIRWEIFAAFVGLLSVCGACDADVKMPAIFGDHMVLQQGQRNSDWGMAATNEEITVTIGQQSHKATAGSDGKFSVALDPMPAGGPHTLAVTGKNSIKFDDVLVGEVWVCSGQSNMQWSVNASNDADMEK